MNLPKRPIHCFLIACLCLCMGSASLLGQETKSGKVEGWANVPGGKVWLRPGMDAYEHDTGLVRDLQTGQRRSPITPESIANRYPRNPSYPLTVPQPPIVVIPPAPPRSPYVIPPSAPPAYQPYQPYQSQPYFNSAGYDYGPNNIYAYSPQPCNGCGAKLGSPGAINSRWTRVQ